jgi:hypothetical protein
MVKKKGGRLFKGVTYAVVQTIVENKADEDHNASDTHDSEAE